MKEFLLALLQAVLIAAIPVITAHLCTFLKTARDGAKQHTSDDTARRWLEDAFNAVITAVKCTNQTYVDTLKKNGTFTLENQREAFQKSYDTALSIMTQEVKDFIQSAYGDLNKWLTAQIEAQVKSEKTAENVK